jgi:eukaryotic-like serine/threonine-protein kinase
MTRRRLLLAASGLTLVLLILVILWSLSPPRDPGGPPDDAWCLKVRNFPPRDRVRIVLDKLHELNRGFARTTGDWLEPEVLLFHESTDSLSDIRPLGALAGIKELSLTGSKRGLGQLTDLAPLKGMKLMYLSLARNPELKDLSLLQGMPLYKVDLSDTNVQSLADLADAPLMHLNIARSSVSDLKPLGRMKQLISLDCTGCPISSFEPLKDTLLKDLKADLNREHDAAILKAIPNLRTLNEVPLKKQ